jgi:hypothetical protein
MSAADGVQDAVVSVVKLPGLTGWQLATVTASADPPNLRRTLAAGGGIPDPIRVPETDRSVAMRTVLPLVHDIHAATPDLPWAGLGEVAATVERLGLDAV